jgi:hypothetical protein
MINPKMSQIFHNIFSTGYYTISQASEGKETLSQINEFRATTSQDIYLKFNGEDYNIRISELKEAKAERCGCDCMEEQPPIVPKIVWDLTRVQDIMQGMKLCTKQGKEIPIEWIDEFQTLYNSIVYHYNIISHISPINHPTNQTCLLNASKANPTDEDESKPF